MENTSIDNLFKSLETSIQAGKYDEALELLKANQRHFDPGVYHFNLASVLAQKEDLVSARIHYELAMQEGYVSPELRANLAKVKDSLDIQYAESPNGFLDYLNYTYTTLPVDLYLTFILIVLAGLLFGFKAVATRAKVITTVVLMLPVAWAWYHFAGTSVIILKDEQIVREGPSKIFHEAHVAPKGIKLLVGKEYTDYLEVIYPQTFKGWISKSGHFILRD